MALELGIALDLGGATSPETLTSLAAHAEQSGLDLVVVTAPDDDPTAGSNAGLDPWTTTAWLVGATKHIQIGVTPPAPTSDPTDPAAPYASVLAKARESLDLLGGTRLLTDPDAWLVAAPGASEETLCSLADDGRPVVVPVTSTSDIDRLAALRVVHGAPQGPGPRRSASVRARRRPGISYDDLPAGLADAAVEPGDERYRRVRSTYLRSGEPGLVLRPRTPEEVADALAFARRHTHLPLGIRSGGHGVSGRSTNDGGIVIDVGSLDDIEVLDTERRLVRIGPGATWKQVAAALDPYGWALGSGDYGGVGVGGLATAGGIGLLGRGHGLTIDHVRAVELVLADGTQVRATEDEHPDLFWAVRGAGANFGVATAFEFEVYDVGNLGWAKLTLVSPDVEDSLRRYGELASTAPRDTTVFLVTGRPRQGQSVIQLYAMVDSPDPDVIVERLRPFAEDLGTLAQQDVVLTRYAGVMGEAADVGPEGHQGYGEPVTRSGLLPALTPEFARDAAALLRSGQVYFFQLRAMGGAIGDVPPDETAFSHRDAAFQVTAMGADRAALDLAWEGIAAHLDGTYLSFETDLRPERLTDAFPPPVLDRLRAVKRVYDPDNLFRDNFNVAATLTEEVS